MLFLSLNNINIEFAETIELILKLYTTAEVLFINI